MASNEVIVGYPTMRGKAGIIRSLLAYCNIPFKNKFHDDRALWLSKEKNELNTDYPNFPYFIDGEKTITETLAIVHYIAIKAGRRDLIGDTDDKFVKVQTVLGVTVDLGNNLSALMWTTGDFETEKNESFSNGIAKEKLEVLNKSLEDKEWLCGFFSVADFYLFEDLDWAIQMEPKLFEKYPNLEKFHRRFNDQPEYKTHRESADFCYIYGLPGYSAWTNNKGDSKIFDYID